MFSPSIKIAGLYRTKQATQIVFLSCRGSKWGLKNLCFLSAESIDSAEGTFSKETLALSRGLFSLVSTLPKEQTLTKENALPILPLKERMQCAQTHLGQSGLYQSERLVFAFSMGIKKLHLFCAREKTVIDHLNACRPLGFSPTVLTMPCEALVNFARFVCQLESGLFLHLDDDEGLLVDLVEGHLKSARTFSYDAVSRESLVTQLRRVLENSGVDPVWITGPGAVENGLTNYLQAAFGSNFQKPKVRDIKVSDHVCHTFALAIGSAIEGAKKPSMQANFRTGSLASSRLMIRRSARDIFAALHLSLCLFALYFALDSWVQSHHMIHAHEECEKQIEHDLALLVQKTARMPHALRRGEVCPRASIGLRRMEPQAEGFTYSCIESADEKN